MSKSKVAADTPAPLRILVVDDNYDAAESMTVLLGLFGNEVEMRHDGIAAVEAFTAFKPNVILLDISLPGLDGYGAAEQIRRLPGGAAVALVAMTGHGGAGDMRRSAAAGFDKHLVKPVQPNTLIELLSSIAQAAASPGLEVQ